MGDNIFGFIIFAVIAGVTILGKIKESRGEQDRDKGRKILRREDLPEATRRMLYGDVEDIRTAKPRQARPSATHTPRVQPIPTAQPRQAPPQRRQAPPQRQAATPAPRQAPPRRAPQVTTRQARQQLHRTLREVARPSRKADPSWTPQQHRHTQPQKTRAQRQPDPAWTPEQHQHVQRQKTRTQRQAAQRAVAPPEERRPSSRRPSMSTWLRHPDTMRKGIILREILGPPKGFDFP